MDHHKKASRHVSRRDERRLTTSETPSRRGDLPGLDQHIGFLLRLAYQRATANLAQEIADSQLTPVQFATLLRLHERGSLSQNELGRNVGMPPANIHATVRRLVAGGLLRTRQSTTDGRIVHVELTSKGRRVLQQVLPGATKANANTLSRLSIVEQRTLMDLLVKLAS
jgi:DNA-binding MarR family transcriptional regulator